VTEEYLLSVPTELL